MSESSTPRAMTRPTKKALSRRRRTMSLELSTILDAPLERVWQEVNRPELLRYVAAPLLTFTPVEPARFPEVWEEREYVTRIRQFGILPLGLQVIHIERPSSPDRTHLLRDNGRGSLSRIWDHMILVEGLPGERTKYTDRVEVGAGLLTPLIWAFARVFYAHRQRRWHKLVASRFSYVSERRSPS